MKPIKQHEESAIAMNNDDSIQKNRIFSSQPGLAGIQMFAIAAA
jgi:hypothetical protein